MAFSVGEKNCLTGVAKFATFASVKHHRLEVRREHWRPIPGYPGFWASTQGNIFAGGSPWIYVRKHGRRDSVVNGYGYCVTNIGCSQMGTHCLVALAFWGPCPEGHEVDHVDGDRTNNRPWNLEYVTHQENMRRAAERRKAA